MSYEQTIEDFFWEPTTYPVESVLQLPHEGDYSNADQFKNFSIKQLLDNPTAVDVAESPLAKEFREKVATWKRDTRGLSSVSEIVLHPSYQWIMGKGKPALPFILRELQQNGGQWFHALYYIHGRDEAAGTKTVAEATAVWIEWGYRNNHI